MALSSVGTLSTLTPEGWPLSVGVRFAVDEENGTPVLCLTGSYSHFSVDKRSSLHVQVIRQCYSFFQLKILKLDGFFGDCYWVWFWSVRAEWNEDASVHNSRQP